MNTFTVETTFPPSLEGAPVLAMLTVMAFWTMVLIVLRWMYEILNEQVARPAPAGSYVRRARVVRLLLLAASITTTGPRLVQLMTWQTLTPAAREMLSVACWLVLIPASVMTVAAWWRQKQIVFTERDYVRTHGFVSLVPFPKQEKTQGVTVVVLIFVVAFATTFVRPRPHANVIASSAAADAERR